MPVISYRIYIKHSQKYYLGTSLLFNRDRSGEPIERTEATLVMGYEYESFFTPPLSSLSMERLLIDLKQPPTWPLLRTEQDGQTHILHYTYAAGGLPVWEEDFLLCLSPRKLYVLLHTAPGEQASAVLGWLQRCLPTDGLATATLEEL